MQGTYLGGYPWKDSGILTAADLNAAIGVATELAGDAVQRTGDTMTGALVINLNAAPATPPGGGTVLHLKGIDGATEHIYINAYSNGIFGAAPNIQFAAAAGTGAAPAPLGAGDFLGSLSYAGYWRSAAGASGWSTNRVALNAFALDNFSDTAQGTQLLVRTTPRGTTNLTTVLTIGPGLQVGAPNLGDQGAGSINAQRIYVNGQAVGAATGAVPIVGGTMSGMLVVNLNTAPAQPPMAGTNLQLSGTDGNITRLEVDSYNNANPGASSNITLRSTRGTAAAPAALQINDVIGGMVFRGWNGSGYSAANRATVNCVAAENWGTVAPAGEGTRLILGTTAVGTTTLTTRLAIGQGLVVGAATGGSMPLVGDMGAGTINAQAVYVNGVAVAAGGLAGAVPLVGGTMTGALGVNFNPAGLAVTGLGIPLIHTAGADNNPGMIIMDAYTTSGNTPTLNFRTAGGTGATPATIPSTGYLGALRFFGYDATAGSFEHGTAALIRAAVNGPWSSTSHPTRFDFSVAQPGATGYPTSPVSMTLAQGLVVGGPTGGDQGFGSINAQAVYVQGQSVAFNAVARTGDTMTGGLVINLNPAPASPPAGGTILHLKGVDGATEHIYINAYSNGIFGAAPNITLAAARGTGTAPAALQAGDFLGALSFQGYWQSALGASGWSGNRVAINAFALENWSDLRQGSQVQIRTTPLGTVNMVAGLTVGPGVQVGAPTGGDLGPGTLNATGLFINGAAVGTATGGAPPGGMAGQAQYNLGGTAFGGSPGLTLSTTAVTALNVGGDAAGDIYYRSATGFTRLGIGGAGTVLTVSAGLPSWGATGAGTITAVNPGVGLTGGGATGSVTLSVSTVPVANGGTNAGTPAAALANLQGLPLTGGTISGSLAIGVPPSAGLGSGTLVINANIAAPPVPVAGGTVLQLAGLDNNLTRFQIDAFTGAASTGGAVLSLRSARGIGSGPGATQLNDILGGITWRGYSSNPAGYSAGNRATINVLAAENFGPGEGTQIVLSTTTPGGTTLVHPLTIGQGLMVGTGADMGLNTVNVGAGGGFYVNGTLLTPGTGAGTVNPPALANQVAYYNTTAAAVVSSSGMTFSGTAVTALNVGLDAIGDIYYRATGGFSRLPIGGTAGMVLTVAAGIPVWQAVPPLAAGSVTNAMLATAPANTVKGSITGTGAPIDLSVVQQSTMLNLAQYATTASPTFTGTITAAAANFSGAVVFTASPTVPNVTAGNSSTLAANTAFVTAAVPLGSSTMPVMDGTATIGTLGTWAHADHVHSSDTSRLALAGGTLTGALVVNLNAAALIAPAAGNVLQLGNLDGQPTRLTIDTFGGVPNISFRRTDGTNVAYPTNALPIANGDNLGNLGWQGWVNGALSGGRALISAVASEGWTAAAQGTALNFTTTATGTLNTVANMTLDGSGNLTILGATATKPGSTAWVNPSEARLKEAVELYRAGLTEVCRLEPISYRYTGSHGMPAGMTFYGLDAEATREAMPELTCVVRHSWGGEEDRQTEDLLAIDSGPLVFALCNAVKELAAQVRDLRERS